MKKATKYVLVLTAAVICLFLVVHAYYLIVGFSPVVGSDVGLGQAITMNIEYFFRRYVVFIIFAALVVWLIYFWISMLIDCVRRNFTQPNERFLWVLVIIFAGIVGAAVYYFMIVRRKSAG